MLGLGYPNLLQAQQLPQIVRIFVAPVESKNDLFDRVVPAIAGISVFANQRPISLWAFTMPGLMPWLKPTDPPSKDFLRPPVLLGSLFLTGFAPVLRGTFGTAMATWPALLLLHLPFWWLIATWAGAALGFCLLSLAVGRAVLRRYPNLKDPGWFVLDEAAGVYLTCLLFGATTALDICFAFLTFRVYDICKPWPVRVFERLPGSVGILADDLAAAIYAGLTCWGLRGLMHLI
ncbi:MAG: phosphatidylglycerophosphatase A [Planctomycetes bacterium]|nr:phosphatidylglycerophosphatase A [Planctomycetota bacterium]